MCHNSLKTTPLLARPLLKTRNLKIVQTQQTAPPRDAESVGNSRGTVHFCHTVHFTV